MLNSLLCQTKIPMSSNVGEPWNEHVMLDVLVWFKASVLFEIQSVVLVCLELHHGELCNSCLNCVFEEGFPFTLSLA